jgi:hypothetical protein
MARNVFISFRYSDGYEYKDELAALFNESDDTVDFSEDEDRSQMSDDSIQKFLYGKLKRSSVTIILLTPKAIKYNTTIQHVPYSYQYNTVFDDWIYDEVRYSLEDREGNATNALVAVYVPEAEQYLFQRRTHKCFVCNKESEVLSILDCNNLFRVNMMNVKPDYKVNKCPGIYDSDWDSYCSLVAYDDFKKDFAKYIDNAYKKRGELYKYNLVKRLQP